MSPEEQVAVLEQALRDVCNPLDYLRRRAEAEGSALNSMAYQLANSLAFVQSIATYALAQQKRQAPKDLPVVETADFLR